MASQTSGSDTLSPPGAYGTQLDEMDEQKPTWLSDKVLLRQLLRQETVKPLQGTIAAGFKPLMSELQDTNAYLRDVFPFAPVVRHRTLLPGRYSLSL